MKFNAACTTAVLALLLAGALTSNAQRDYKDQSMDLLRLLASKPWFHGPYGRWEPRPPEMDSSIPLDDADEDFKMSSKRSAVATALNTGRRRRQPAPALGVLNDVGSFFDSLRDNLETLTSLTPEQRSTLFQGPSVVHAPSTDLTTADLSWRRRAIPTRTDMTPGCCGPDLDARAPFPHPHARLNLYRNTRDAYTAPEAVASFSAINNLPRVLPILFPEYFAAYEKQNTPVENRKSFEIPQKEIAQDFYRYAHVPLDSTLGRALLLEYLGYNFPRPNDEVDIEEPINRSMHNHDDDSHKIVGRQTGRAPCHRRGPCNHF